MKLFNFIVLALAFTFAHSMAIKDEISETLDTINANIYIKKNEVDIKKNIIDGFNNVMESIGHLKNFGGMNAATSNALKYMKNTKEVTITSHKKYYHFKGQNNKKALVFYQGAFVDEKAYAELMYKLAENGIDGFLVKMPLRFAIGGFNKAADIIKENKTRYQEFYIGGHSMGGAAASIFAFVHKKDVKGIALLASFSILPLPKDMKAVSILASNDKILRWDQYEKFRKNLPTGFTEITIEGGNHGQFGDYGHQHGDGKATISIEKQHQITIDAILKVFN